MSFNNNHRYMWVRLCLGALLLLALLAWPGAVPSGRAAERVGNAIALKVSPDDHYVVYSAPLPNPTGSYGLFSRSLPHGQPIRLDQDGSSVAPLFAISPDSQRVVYSQTLSGSVVLASASLTGTGRVALGSIPAQYGAVTSIIFGADPQHAVVTTLASSSSEGMGVYLFGLPLAGGGPLLLDQGGLVGIAPSGTQVVYVQPVSSPPTLPAALYSVPLSGGAPVKLGLPVEPGTLSYLARYPRWSAFSRDGSRLIVFITNNIYSLALDGSPAVKLNQEIEVMPAPFAWAWMEQYTPFVRVPGTDDLIFSATASGLYRVPVGGGTPTPVPGTLEHQASQFYQVSPDGRWLVYASAAAPYHLFRVALDSGETADLGVSLRTGKYGYVLEISPDSSRVLVRSDGDTRIYSIALAGGAPVNISNGLQVTYTTNVLISSDSRSALIGSRFLVPLQQAGAPFPIIDPALGDRDVVSVAMAPGSGSLVFMVSEDSQSYALYVESMEPGYVFLPQMQR